MKNTLLLLLLLLLFIPFISFSQEIKSKVDNGILSINKQETIDKFKLYRTDNMWTFLKLDTSSGEIWQVQYSVNKDLQGEVVLNSVKFAFGDDMQNGRFQIYNTKNHFNFLLLDSVDGSLWQFQWGLKEESRGLIYKY